MKEINIRDIEGIKIGNEQDFEGATGCTVIICEAGAVGGVDVRGGSPGTRETDLLNPVNMVQQIHAVVLSGGSAFGLDASSGVMKYLEERNIGFDAGVAKVPIVASAVLFDLVIGRANVRPDKDMGYSACKNAEKIDSMKRCNNFEGNILQQIDLLGSIGAGTGATVGKINGPQNAMKGGLGSCAFQAGELKVGAIAAVNCLGDVIDPKTGKILAGALREDKKTFLNTEDFMISRYDNKKNIFNGNTTIGVVVTNAKLNKAQANKIASMAHNGYGRTMRPAHTMQDGDTIFVLATGEVEADINVIGLIAAKAIEESVVRAVKHADSLHGYISYKDIFKKS